MLKIFSTIIDSVAAYSLNKNHSSKSHFYYNPNLDLNWTINTTVPKIKYSKLHTIDNYSFGQFEYKSKIQNGTCNDNVNIEYKTVLPANNNIIFIHGWKSSSFDKLDSIFLKSFMNNNYNLYYYTMPFHIDRNDTGYSGEYFLSSNINRTITSVQQSISDLTALISYIKSFSTGKIIVIGLSLGGLVSNMLCALDSRFDCLISLFYANTLSYTVFNSIPGRDIKKDFIKHNLSENQLTDYWNFINPSVYTPQVENILLISGKNDCYIPINDSNLLWLNWNKPKRIVYNCGHSGIVFLKKKIHNDVFDFLKNLNFVNY